MDPEKVSAVMDWETPTCIRDVQCFLGFANFYRRFIEGFSRTCTPLFNLLKKADSTSPNYPDGSAIPVKQRAGATPPDKPVKSAPREKAPFPWNDDCDRVFEELKNKFCTAPILKHFDPELETILETDASDYLVSGILS